MKLRILPIAVVYAAGLNVLATAHEYNFAAVLTGVAQSPSNGSPAVGNAEVMLDLDEINMHLEVSFNGLLVER